MMDLLRRKLFAGALAVIAVTLAGYRSDAQARAAASKGRKERVVKITASKFAYSPSEIRLVQGEQVVLELSAVDFVHGFNVPSLKLRADLTPGKVTRIPFPTDKADVFDFLCDNFCGSGHEEMSGKITVVAAAARAGSGAARP